MRIDFIVKINSIIDGVGEETQILCKQKSYVIKITDTDSKDFEKAKNAHTEAADLPTDDVSQLNKLDISGNQNEEITEMNKLKNKIYEKGNGLKEYRFTYENKRYSVYGRSETQIYNKYVLLKKGIKKEPVKKQTQGITFYEWLDKWSVLYKKESLTESSFKQLESYIKRIKENIKDKLLKKITDENVLTYLNGLPPTRTKEAIYSLLNDCLGRATLKQLIKINPLAEYCYKHKRVKGISLTVKEESDFWEKVEKLQNEELKLFFKICALTGGRRGEILSLAWEDFNFNTKMLHLRGTKTEGSDRYIPMSDRLIDIVSGVKQSSGKLFSLNEDYVTGKFKEIMPKHKLHNLRHTFATRCLESGVNMKTLQSWLGHSTYEQTANTYSHVLEVFNKSEINKLNK